MSSDSWDDLPQQTITQERPKRTWSPEQLAMAKWAKESKGNGKVTARAGTGKTTSVEGCVIPSAPESKILYVVFNKKNQLEAKEKITDARVDIKTFNALGFAFVRNQWKGCRPDDMVERDRVRAVEKDIPYSVMGEVLKLIGWAKNCDAHASLGDLEEIALFKGFEAEVEEERAWPVGRIAEAAFEAMALAKQPDSGGRISFNDQLWLPVVMGWVRPWWDLVIVDEAQDTNPTQKEMIEKCYRRGGRILFVGDDRQAIYAFRGADADSLTQLGKRFNTEPMSLTTTYRCAKAIVREANVEVPDLKAMEGAAEGEVREISSATLIKEAKEGDAILSRTNAPLMPVCLSLLKAGKRARIEGKDIGRALLAIAEKWKARTVPEFLSLCQGWKNKKIHRIKAKKMPEDMAISQIEAVEDQASIFVAVAEDAKSIGEISTRLTTLFGDTEGGQGGVTLSSVHRAKGLEWERVFLLSETFRRARGDEEANIWYVGVTRAKRELVWVA